MYRQDGSGQAAAGFGVEFEWDTPLLEGYRYLWLKNISRQPSLNSFGGCDTPEIYEILRRRRFDAVLVIGWNRKSAFQAIRGCWQNHIPVIMRGDSQLNTARSRVKQMVKYAPYRLFLPRLTHLYVGERNRAYLRHYGVPESQLFFSPHFIDDLLFRRGPETESDAASIRGEMNIPADAFVFIFMGKMTDKKRPTDFVLACRKLMSMPEGANVHAILIGDGNLRPTLEKLAAPFMRRIHFTGFRNQTELPGYYCAADALILPSSSEETWGLVVNEAAACGVPSIVSHTVGCAPDLIEEGMTGYVYPFGDVDALVERMCSLMKACQDRPRALRRALEEKTAIYSMTRATEGLNNALKKLTSK
jgi:glycosyltransferase involved in cell wall biosynthesis